VYSGPRATSSAEGPPITGPGRPGRTIPAAARSSSGRTSPPSSTIKEHIRPGDRGKTDRKFGLPAKLLKDGLGRELLRREGQLEMVDDAVDDGGLGEKRDDLHHASAAGAFHGVDLVDLADHGCPALGMNHDKHLLFILII
jgi:hypothetical protein